MAITARVGAFLLLCAVALWSQWAYDASHARLAIPPRLPSADFVRSFDLGLHSAAASFFWLSVRSELPRLRQGAEYFLSGLRLVNDLSPRWSTPYAFAVLVLPNMPSYEERVPAALAVGERGLVNATADWRIPFYMGAIYQLELNDRKNAALYFDIAAATPGIPDIIRRFAINYGIHPDSIAATKASWNIIYETSRDAAVRERAAEHIAHLEMLERLNAAVRAFHLKNGRYPADLEEVARAGFLDDVPRSPFGFDFKIYDRGVVGIAPADN